MPVWSWGRGRPQAVMLPGLVEGLLDGWGLAVALRWLVGRLLGRCPVVVVGHRETIPPQYTTRQMAADAVAAMEQLELGPLPVVGLGAGGLLARWVAQQAPGLCSHLVLVGCLPEGPLPAAVDRFFEQLAYAARHTGWRAAFQQALAARLGDPPPGVAAWQLQLVARWGTPSEPERLVRQLAAYRRHPAPPGPCPVPLLVAGAAHDPLWAEGLAGSWGFQGPAEPGRAGGAPPRPRRWVLVAGSPQRLWDADGTVTAEVRRFLELPPWPATAPGELPA